MADPTQFSSFAPGGMGDQYLQRSRAAREEMEQRSRRNYEGGGSSVIPVIAVGVLAASHRLRMGFLIICLGVFVVGQTSPRSPEHSPSSPERKPISLEHS